MCIYGAIDDRFSKLNYFFSIRSIRLGMVADNIIPEFFLLFQSLLPGPPLETRDRAHDNAVFPLFKQFLN